MSIVPKVKFSNGLKMPAIGFGTFSIKEDICIKIVKYAIDKGYRHFDTALAYENEREVGEAIRQKISEGVVKREDIFLTTKLMMPNDSWGHETRISKAPGPGPTIESKTITNFFQKSVKKLGLDYIDLYLMHFPVGFVYIDDDTHRPKKNEADTIVMTNDVDYIDTWKAMEKLVDKGLVRSIGISNFNSHQVVRLLKNCRIKPVVNQVECNIDFNQKKLVDFCQQRNILILAFCPVARPNSETKKPEFFFDERTIAIAKKYNKTAANVTLRYLVERGIVPIPRSVINHEIDENIEIFDFKLTKEEMKILDSMHTGHRISHFEFIDSNHKYFPFNSEF